MLSLATIASKPLRWLWPHHIPVGKLSLLVGAQGAGKTFVALDLAARVSSGKSWPLSSDPPGQQGDVLLLTEVEDLADITRPRLEAAGADLNRIIIAPTSPQPADKPSTGSQGQPAPTPHDSPTLTLPLDIPVLETAINNTPHCRLVVIDPLSAFLPSGSAPRRVDLPSIFKALAALAARTGVAIVATVNYLASTSPAANRRAVARLAAHPGPTCVYHIAVDSQVPANRLLHTVKNNLAPPTAPLVLNLCHSAEHGTAQVVWSEVSLPQNPSPPRSSRQRPSPTTASPTTASPTTASPTTASPTAAPPPSPADDFLAPFSPGTPGEKGWG